ncbi:MAG: ABC transporter ATP-binding protein [Bacilli bacterium]
MSHLLEVTDLHTSFMIPAGEVKSVNGVSFNLDEKKILGIVGESGSGKSVTAYSIMQILSYPGKIVGGSIKYKGKELVGLPDKEMAKLRGNKISIIFQDPMTCLNPVYTIGNQLVEAIMIHQKADAKKGKKEIKKDKNGKVIKDKDIAKERAKHMLDLVGINDIDRRMKQYPFEFSGGMLQRIMIAMALVCEPDILIADEPTTALDVTIQAQILELLKSIQEKMGMAIIIITHDLGVVAQICDEVDVMYAGRIVEKGTVDEIFYNPQHEYTKGLLKSIPRLKNSTKLVPIEGNPVDVFALPKGCSFAPRCSECMEICLEKYPQMHSVNEIHETACFKFMQSLYEAKKISEKEFSDYLNKCESNEKAKTEGGKKHEKAK